MQRKVERVVAQRYDVFCATSGIMRVRTITIWMLIAIFMCLTACTASVLQHSRPITLHPLDKIAVLPFANNTETPLAGERAMSITAAELQSFGIRHVVAYQTRNQGKILFPGMNKIESEQALLAWARTTNARFVMTGSVNEWSYKVGLDGEPVVGIDLKLIDLHSGQVVWTAVASRSGGSRVAVSTVAQQVIDAMLKYLCYATARYVR